MPVHDRIPREIFERILYLCVSWERPVRDLETLQLVCRTWRDIIAEASFLWGTITTLERPREYHKALRMAKGSSLDIIFWHACMWPIPEEMQIDSRTPLNFLTLAGEKIDQWRSLEIRSGDMGKALAFFQTQNPPPKLEILSIESEYFEWYSQYGFHDDCPVVVLFRGAPVTRLKHVKLNRAPINIRSLGLAGLKSLLLRHIPSTTAADIVTILNNCPTLTTLRLAVLQLATDEPNPSPIHLPFLVDIELDDLPFPFFRLLLSNLVVPQLRSLYVIGGAPVINQLLAIKTGNLNTTLTFVTSGARNYEIVWSRECRITIGGLDIHLTWDSGQISRALDLDVTFGRLSDHLRGLGLADLPLHLSFDLYLPVLSDYEWFTRKTNVTSLSLAFGPWCEDWVNPAIYLLGQPTSGPSPIWLLPQVELFEVEIGTKELRRLVVDMIKARHAAVPDSFLGAHGTVPKLFREIWLYHEGNYNLYWPHEEIRIELVQAAKGADVHWVESQKPKRSYQIRWSL